MNDLIEKFNNLAVKYSAKLDIIMDSYLIYSKIESLSNVDPEYKEALKKIQSKITVVYSGLIQISIAVKSDPVGHDHDEDNIYLDCYDFLNEEYDNIAKEFEMIQISSAKKVSDQIMKEIVKKYERSNP